jgi:phage shock protein E
MTIRSFRVRVLALAAVAAVALAACSSGPAEPAAFDGAHVSASAFAPVVEQTGVVVVDVRTPAEFADGHLPGAVNINVEDPSFAAEIAALDAEGEYAVYCRSANRSRVAMDYMAQVGVTRTVGLEGGISAWQGTVER